MAKTKTPFFSLEARGSVGGSITAQGRGASTLVREKPFPTDPYSLPQAYQRWLYEDYAYRWTQQSEATRAEYRSAGVRYHLTGFQYWMKVMLGTMPDILGWWKLDERIGAVAYDSSKNPANATIIGATPTAGVIDGGYILDGINDRFNIGNPSKLENLTACTYLCFFNSPPFTGILRYLYYASYWQAPLGFLVSLHPNTNQIQYLLRSPTNLFANRLLAFTPGANHCAGFTWDGITARYYMDGIQDLPGIAFVGPLACSGRPIEMGAYWSGSWYDGLLDNTILFNRALDDTEMLRWALRRYPAQ